MLCRGYDEDGKQVSKKVKYAPTLYVDDPEKTTPFKTIHEEPVKPYHFPDMRQCKEFCDMYPGNLHGNTNHVVAYIQNEFPNTIQYNPEVIRVLDFDIETESSRGFIDPSVADGAILTIAAKCAQCDGRMHVWGTKEYTGDGNISYHKCSSEFELLTEFLSWWKYINPDVITGWNCQFYDVPFLINRAIRVLGEKEAKQFSPWKNLQEKTVQTVGRTQQTYDIMGISILDYMDLIKKFTYTELENYKLNTAAVEFLKEEKLDYADFGTLAALYEGDYNKFVDYNALDVGLVERLEEALGLIKLVYTMSYMAGVNYTVTLGTTALWDAIIFRHLSRKRVVIPFNDSHQQQNFAGGYVKDVVPGKYEWVMSFDLNSLYPSIMMQNNVSPDTIVPQSRIACTPDDLLEKKVESPDDNLALAANGTVYRRDKKGFIPEIVEELYAKRVELKKKMLEADHNKQSASSKSEAEKFDKQRVLFKTQQMALKIALNSLYGAMSNKFFRYFDISIAEGITLTGQTVIKTADRAANDYVNKLLKTRKDRVPCVDTDSVYLVCEDIISRFKPKCEVDFLDEFAKKGIEPALAKAFKEYAKRTNALENKMEMSREVIATRGVWTAKKRYLLNVLDNEGVRYKEPKLKIMGIEAIKSSTPAVCRTAMKDIFKVLLNGTEEESQEMVRKFKREFFKMSPEQVACPRSVSDMEKYADTDRIYVKQKGSSTPINARGALLYNHYLKEHKITHLYESLNSGDKLKYTYLKVPNPIRENVIAFPTKLPEEFGLHRYIDYEVQFEKNFEKPMSTIFRAMGWTIEPVSNLQSFFI